MRSRLVQVKQPEGDVRRERSAVVAMMTMNANLVELCEGDCVLVLCC